ncbi:hypothetical protein [Roseivirga sp.]|uniref:hypothetical protein n=1 Tax=Roseivirga sp. TaxID=1964215 RepID=UPI003B517482
MARLKLPTLSVFLLIVIFSLPVHAQDQKSLDRTFTEILDEAESYEEYKVIRTSKLRNFREAMYDSLTAYKSTIATLQSDLSEVQQEMEELKSQFTTVQQSLQQSQASSDLIGFLWFDMNKMTYTIFVWSLVALLSLCLLIMYGRIKHVCGVVKRVKTAYSKIVDDYRNQRFQATEKQMKLKRELQTALNRLENMQAMENGQH